MKPKTRFEQRVERTAELEVSVLASSKYPFDEKGPIEDGPPHWFRDCSKCEQDFLLPVCPHRSAQCPSGHEVIVDTNDCDCFDNSELLEYPCNCQGCMQAYEDACEAELWDQTLPDGLEDE